MRRLNPPSLAKTVAASGGVDRGKLEHWLLEHPPGSLVPLADRLLIAAVDRRRREGPIMAAQALPHLVAAAQRPEAVSQITALAVCISAIDDLGIDAADLRFRVAILVRAVDVDHFEEPYRSTARYWLWRAALRRDHQDPGDDTIPADPRLRFMHQTHRVLCAAGYGMTTIDAATAPGLAKALVPVDPDDGDMVALSLLCAACVTPRPDISGLRLHLKALQVKNGSLRTRVDDPVARHHAACVAALALALLDDD
jgi:hypothetical protein